MSLASVTTLVVAKRPFLIISFFSIFISGHSSLKKGICFLLYFSFYSLLLLLWIRGFFFYSIGYLPVFVHFDAYVSKSDQWEREPLQAGSCTLFIGLHLFWSIFLLLQQDVVGSLCILNLCSNLGISDFTKKSCFVLVESDTGNKNLGVQDASFYWDVTAPRFFQTERATMLVCLLYKHEFITISNIKSPKVKKKKKNPQRFFLTPFYLYLFFLIVRSLIPQKSQYSYSFAQSDSNEISTPSSLPTTNLSWRFLCISFCP